MKYYEGLDDKLIPIIEKFEKETNIFVEDLLKDHKPSGRTINSRVINDPIWGSIYFKYYELKVLDSPIMQRLRYISQVGLAWQVFPSARHSRFEHSIGVFHVASEIINNINKRTEKEIISKRQFSMIRLAALLHDIGHCYYSHVSERVYGNMAEFNELKTHPLFEYKKAKGHEIFAYFIINSMAFKRFFKSLDPNIDDYDNDDFYDSIGRMIVGYPVEEIDTNLQGRQLIKNHFMTNIINGGFDADKLDYIRRDVRFTGLCPDYDLARLLYRINIVDIPEESVEGKFEKIIHRNLVIPLNGVSAIEEIAFAKIQLTSSVYYHQKVLATDELMVDFSNHLIKKKLVDHPCGFLYLTEKTIEKKEEFNTRITLNTAKTFYSILKNIEKRGLPKRVLEIKMAYIKQSSDEPKQNITELAVIEKGNIQKQMKMIDDMREGILQISINILKRLGESFLATEFENIELFDKFDISASFRNKPSFTSEDIIVYGSNKKPQPLNEIIPLGEWTQAFAANKWSGYIFSREDIIPLVNLAARGYFENKFGIVLNEVAKYDCLKETDFEKVRKIEKTIDVQEIIKQFFSQIPPAKP